jgi:phosphopentomutase
MFVGIRPRAFYVSLGETDDWAHEGRYERVIRAAHEFDRFVAKLWQAVQSTEGYRDQTVFVLTVDHGRGPAPVAWKDHGRQIPGAAAIWFAVIGPDTRPLGERKGTAPVIQAQIASTVAALVGEDFRSGVPAAAAVVAEVVGPAGSGLGR